MDRLGIAFSTLKQLLLAHGFVLHEPPTGYYVFVHEPSETWLTMPTYGEETPVALHHLTSTRRMLDERGLLTAEAFDALLAGTQAAA